MNDPRRFDHLPDGMWQNSAGDYVLHADYAHLKAEVERLRKAGDELSWAFAFAVSRDDGKESGLIKAWNAAKEGKPSV